MLDFVKNILDIPEVRTAIISIIIALLSFIGVCIKTKRSILTKRLIEINKQIACEFNPDDYYILISGYKFNFDEVQIVKKEVSENEQKKVKKAKR